MNESDQLQQNLSNTRMCLFFLNFCKSWGFGIKFPTFSGPSQVKKWLSQECFGLERIRTGHTPIFDLSLSLRFSLPLKNGVVQNHCPPTSHRPPTTVTPTTTRQHRPPTTYLKNNRPPTKGTIDHRSEKPPTTDQWL